MKILIADDDAYTREGLVESIDWETLGIDEIMQAVNGQDALTTARWFHPDIILTDIRMPQMDGLAFARELLAGSRESRVIFISGYMEIDYLKDAIQLSAVDFIEKPIDRAALRRALERAVEEVREIRRHRAAVEDQRNIRQQTLVRLLCSEQPDPKTIEKLAQEEGFPLTGIYVCVFLQYSAKQPLSEEDDDRLMASIQACSAKALGRWDKEKRQFQMVLALSARNQHQLASICAALSTEFPQCWVGAGAEVEDYRQIRNSSRMAAAAVNCAFYQTERKIFRISREIRGKHAVEPGIYGEFLQILSEPPEKIQDRFCTLFKELQENIYCPREQVCTLVASLLLALYRAYPGLYGKHPAIKNEEDIQLVLTNIESLQEMELLILDLLPCIQDRDMEKKKFSRIVQSAIEYIARHFREKDLSVAQIADYLHFSPDYLNVLFKQETKLTIKQYVNNYRLEKSMAMLEKDFYKVTEIAELCGYDNANYFAKAFRKATGMTPTEYRENHEHL